MKLERAVEVDIVRGIAIALMVAAHTIAFYGPQEFILLRYIGDTVCFTIFLFLFGFSLYISILKKGNTQRVRQKIIKRTALLLLSFYVIAFLTLLSEPKSLTKTLHTILFMYVPGLTEFILPYIFYTALVPSAFFFSKHFFKSSNQSICLWLSFWGVVFYTIGANLSIAAGFVTGGGFPLFQYLIVVLYGIFYGLCWDKTLRKLALNKRIKLIYFLVFVSCMLVLFGIGYFYQFATLDTKERFPPSVLFISVGIIACLGLLAAARLWHFGKAGWILSILGKHALGIFLFHAAIIKLLQYKTIVRIDDTIERLGMFVFLLFGYFLIYGFIRTMKLRFSKTVDG